MPICFLFYISVDVFSVSVTAINQLGNTTVSLNSPFHAQIAPRNLNFGQRSYNIPLGTNYSFYAQAEGTEIHYDWDMGDQTHYKNRGKYVEIFNKRLL